jgi:hypothetical protein
VFARHLVESARLERGALVLAVRLNWYRSVPLSCVERLEVELDGTGLPADRTTLELGDVRASIGDLAGRDDTWWPVLDAATVRVELDAPPRRRTAHGRPRAGHPHPLPGQPERGRRGHR